ncbi:hypothetical protein L873DRAFT_1810754, partial [Choiromyces venosus 120613-1]
RRCLSVLGKQTFKATPAGGSGSMRRKKYTFDAKEKPEKPDYVTTRIFYVNAGTPSSFVITIL